MMRKTQGSAGRQGEKPSSTHLEPVGPLISKDARSFHSSSCLQQQPWFKALHEKHVLLQFLPTMTRER